MSVSRTATASGRSRTGSTRAFLKCGIFAHGFLRLHGGDCGRDLLVAFSCKGRGIFPSCGARRRLSVVSTAVLRMQSLDDRKPFAFPIPASRHKSENGSMSTASVPSLYARDVVPEPEDAVNERLLGDAEEERRS
jgi:hypothetical protein